MKNYSFIKKSLKRGIDFYSSQETTSWLRSETGTSRVGVLFSERTGCGFSVDPMRLSVPERSIISPQELFIFSGVSSWEFDSEAMSLSLIVPEPSEFREFSGITISWAPVWVSLQVNTGGFGEASCGNSCDCGSSTSEFTVSETALLAPVTRRAIQLNQSVFSAVEATSISNPNRVKFFIVPTL